MKHNENKYLIYSIIVFLCLVCALSALQFYFIEQTSKSLKYALIFTIKTIGQFCLILCPIWWMKGKWRLLGIVPIWLFALWIVCNLAYNRFWGELIPASAVNMTGNIGIDLIGWGVGLLKWSDIIILIIPAVITVLILLLNRCSKEVPTVKLRIIATALCLIAFIAGEALNIHSHASWKNELKGSDISDKIAYHYGYSIVNGETAYSVLGPLIFEVKWIIELIHQSGLKKELTTQEKIRIKKFLDARNPATKRDTLSMNVVYMIVESLNTEVVSMRIVDYPIAPVLDSLSNAKGTIYVPNVITQVKHSGSSDGHLMLMTGLLPLKSGSYSEIFGTFNSYPSLAKLLTNHENIMLLADDGKCWNEMNVFKSFGFSKVLNSSDYIKETENESMDGVMLEYASKIIPSLQQPFFIGLMTMSMHFPFKDPGMPMPSQIDNAHGYSKIEKDYLTVVNGFDFQLGKFLKSLPKNTIIIIASDHNQTVANLGYKNPMALFMAINSGKTMKIDNVVGQSNLFPAVLEILGIENANYNGMVPSALDSNINGTIDSYGNIFGSLSDEELHTLNEAFEISDLIIRGDYFKDEISLQ